MTSDPTYDGRSESSLATADSCGRKATPSNNDLLEKILKELEYSIQFQTRLELGPTAVKEVNALLEELQERRYKDAIREAHKDHLQKELNLQEKELQQWRTAFAKVSTFRSEIPLVNIGRQNALNDLKNEISGAKKQ